VRHAGMFNMVFAPSRHRYRDKSPADGREESSAASSVAAPVPARSCEFTNASFAAAQPASISPEPRCIEEQRIDAMNIYQPETALRPAPVTNSGR